AQLQQLRVEGGRAVLVDAGRAAGQHQRARVLGADFLDRGGVRHDLGVDVGLADAAGDELRILRAEVDDEYGVIYLFRHTAILAHARGRAVFGSAPASRGFFALRRPGRPLPAVT